MSQATPAPRRERVEANLYVRPATGRYEIGFVDGGGRQRWRVCEKPGIQAARALRNELLAARGRGEPVPVNPRLKFGAAADAWKDGPLKDLRATTRASYTNSVEKHLRPRFGARRLDQITPDHIAALIRELRAEGLAESTIVAVIGVLGRIYKFAARRLGWAGSNPTSLLLTSERPKMAQAQRPIFEGEALAQVIAAAPEPWRTLFTTAALTGARVSELVGLRWEKVQLDDLDNASITFDEQVDRRGRPQPTKTVGSARTIPVPRDLGVLLVAHRLRQPAHKDGFVFATRTGRPLSQRNVARALRAAQRRARKPDGTPTYPLLHERDERGRPVRVPRGVLPSMHSHRHTFVSRALVAGESIDEVAHLVGHRNGTVTRVIYLHELNDARREAARRSRVAAEYATALEAAAAPIEPEQQDQGAVVRQLRAG